jgi:hypothetical protein
MLTKEQLQELAATVGEETAKKTAKDFEASEKRLNDKMTEVTKGLMKMEDFEKFKADELGKINEQLKEIAKVEAAVKEQGTKMDEVLAKAQEKGTKTIEQFMIDLAPTIAELRKSGKSVEFTAQQLKAAGVTSIGSSVVDQSTPPGSPYLPGIGGAELELFEILRNPNFITSRVDLGRTDRSLLAWANEIEYLGAPAEVEEGGQKPLTQHKFQVEMSKAKKMAAYIEITEEFDQDLPGFGTNVRRLLREDVIRGWDDAIQAAVIAAATPFGITGLNGMVDDPDLWLAQYAMLAQVKHLNFMPNTVAINALTDVAVQAQKNSDGTYLLPPFREEIQRLTVQANKVATGYALAGDLRQYKVDIYKEFVLRVGWINDQFIHNKFCVLGEMRYHRYISDSRKKAIVYDQLARVQTVINSATS